MNEKVKSPIRHNEVNLKAKIYLKNIFNFKYKFNPKNKNIFKYHFK